MPGSASLFHMHALVAFDYAILTYILHFFALCRGPKSGGMAQCSHPKCVPGCACLAQSREAWHKAKKWHKAGHSILVTA